MSDERKQKLLNYLFPNEYIRRFMCNDLYIELENLIPYSLCLNSNNSTNKIRQENLTKARLIVQNFLLENKNYKKELENIYNDLEFKNIVEDIIIGYVFYLSNTRRQFKYLDIFLDKRSICYSPISVVDIL